MNVTVELEREERLTVRRWEQFLFQARRAGANDETPVDEHTHQGTDVVVSYQVKVTDSGGVPRRAVPVPGQAPGCAVRAGRRGAVPAGAGAHAGGAVAGAGVPPRPRRGV
jgi:hypothetical protein